MTLLDHIAFTIRAYTESCACGGTVFIGTDGNGRSTEICDTCHTSFLTPRAVATEHPLFVQHERELLAVRAAIEAERADWPFCGTGCGNHVSCPNAKWCAGCAQERRRRNGREKMRELGGCSARIA